MKRVKFFLLMMFLTMLGATSWASDMPTDISLYSNDGIIKVSSNDYNIDIPVHYLAWKGSSGYGMSYNGSDVISPSGKLYYFGYHSPADLDASYYVSNNGFVFYDLQAIESGIWRLKLVQENAGDWYYYYINYEFVDINGLKYGLSDNDKTAIVSGYSSLPSSGEITIPETITNDGKTYAVTTIRGSAFTGCSELTSVTIPSSVTSIGLSVFSGCSSLTSITINGNNPKYDSRNNCNAIIETGTNTLFVGCASTVIPNSVTSIGNGAFSGCSELTSVTIPSSVTSIGLSAFSGCSSLTSITVDGNNPKYDSRDNCNAIIETGTNTLIVGCASTVIPNSVTGIGSRAFSGCSELTSVTIPNNVTSIGDQAFTGCTNIEKLVLDVKDVTGASSWFSDCKDQIKEVTFGENVETIGEYAFHNFTSLNSVVIPNGVTTIGHGAFDGCSGLTSIEIPSSVTSIADKAFRECSSLTSIEIPGSVTSIGYETFRGCSGLTSIEIPSSVTSIADKAFKECSSLTSIKIPSSVTSIGYEAFRGCSGLTSIEILSSVTSIADKAFRECSSLTSIKIPSSVTSIGDYAFYGCSINTVKVVVTDYSSFCTNTVTGAFGNATIQLLDNSGNEIRDFVIPEGVTTIGEKAFRNCNGLTTVRIPNSVTSIGNNAFNGCSDLTSVSIPDGVTSIGEYNQEIKGKTNVEIISVIA